MAIQASTVFSRVRALLDDDNSNRYSETKDFIPAINSAIAFLTAVFSAAFEQKKIQPESLAELTNVLMFNLLVTGNTVRVNLDGHAAFTPYNEKVWTLIGVDPNPTFKNSPEVLSESLNRFAKRVTLEEWNYALEDPFMPGTLQSIPSDFQRVCYIGPGQYFSDGGGGDSNPYLLIRPGSLFSESTSRIAVWVLMKHQDIVSNSTTIFFPPAVHELLVQKTLYYVSYQHGSSKFLEISDKEVKELITLMN